MDLLEEDDLPDNLSVQNVMATADLGMALDLIALERLVPRAVLTRNRYTCLRVRMMNPKAMVIVHASGKIMSFGAHGERAEMKALLSIRFVRCHIYDAGYRQVQLNDFTIKNILVRGDVGHCIDIEDLHRRTGIVQDPHEMSTGLNFPVPEFNCNVKIFYTGRFVVTGGTKRSQIIQTADRIRQLVRPSISQATHQPLSALRKPAPNLNEARSRYLKCGG